MDDPRTSLPLGGIGVDDDILPPYAEELIEGSPEIPLDAPRTQRSFPIEEVWDEGDRYLGLRVTVDAEYLRAYRRPGQYVTLSPEQLEPRFLVIASPPGSASNGEWEFLVDRETDLGASIDPLERGAILEISPPEGPGYPADEVGGMDVMCFVTGSGIASIRPAIEYWAEREDLAPRTVTVYYGESASGDFAYQQETDEWAREGVRIFKCMQEQGAENSGFQYVQHAFRDDDPDLDESVVFLSGAPVMKRTVVGLLVDRGVPVDRIVTNL